ncbi:hypothetical protein C8J57DRAFT_1528102 [Mycena rebaudengoi]|nr:hypothetical protein C8J57DRAFT_1528102 [Mycena rebaudengoi]
MPPKRNVVESESDLDSDDSVSASVGLASKAKKLPAVDFTDQESSRPARSRKASGKVAENLERDAESKDAQIEKLKKQLKSLSQKHEKTKYDIRERDAERTPPESEEEDEDDTVQMSSFSASIVSKGTVGHTGQKTAPKKLRKSGEAPIATPMARIPLADRATDSNVESSQEDEVPEEEAPAGTENVTPAPSRKRSADRKAVFIENTGWILLPNRASKDTAASFGRTSARQMAGGGASSAHPKVVVPGTWDTTPIFVLEILLLPASRFPRSRLLGHPPPLASDRYRSPPPSSCDSPQPDTARSPLASFCSCRSGPPGSRRPPPSALDPHHWTYSTTFSSRTRPSSDWTPHAPAPPRPPPRHARFRHPLPQPPSYPPKAVLFPPVSPRAIPSESNPLNNRPPQHGATTRSFSSGYRCTVQNP